MGEPLEYYFERMQRTRREDERRRRRKMERNKRGHGRPVLWRCAQASYLRYLHDGQNPKGCARMQGKWGMLQSPRSASYSYWATDGGEQPIEKKKKQSSPSNRYGSSTTLPSDHRLSRAFEAKSCTQAFLLYQVDRMEMGQACPMCMASSMNLCFTIKRV